MKMESPLLLEIEGIKHGFGNRNAPVPPSFLPQWNHLKPSWKQVHGICVAEVREAGQNCGDADALLTEQPGIPIGVMTADCVPILLAKEGGTAVAAVHAGWRGTLAGIIREVWSVLEKKGENPENWIAAIGPSIGPCCYEVSPELVEEFKKTFPQFDPKRIEPEKRKLDLAYLNEAILKEIGILRVDRLHRTQGRIVPSQGCTRCSMDPQGAPLYYSYRREGSGTRQWSTIMISG